MKDTKTNTYIKSFYCILLGLTLFLGCNTTPTSEKQESTPKTVADTTMPVDTAVKKATKPITDTTVKEVTTPAPAASTIRDTVLVLYYFPRTHGRDSQLIVTNKQGQRSWFTPSDIPVQRGDEIICEIAKIDGKKYIRNIPGETFEEWTEENYEEFLYE